jgi:hypothetical protein
MLKTIWFSTKLFETDEPIILMKKLNTDLPSVIRT